MSETKPQLQLTAVRIDGAFNHWTMSGGTNCSDPATCTVSVANSNNAHITITISDPDRPSSAPPITFSQNPMLVPPTEEIHHLTGKGTATIKFKDHNWDAGSIKYILNFDNALSIDPIIQNGGGGPPHRALGFISFPTTTQQLVIDLGVAFILGIIVALIVRRLF